MSSSRVYRRPFGVFHDRRVREEIARLDAKHDCQRIVYLLAAYEFPFDLTRALEIALFHTYGSRSVARLLHRTGEFTRRGQKRYDDTNLLIAHFVEEGWDGPLGQRAIARMNAIHAHYRIPNDDYLFVLWTFIDFPFTWMDAFGWRRFTPHERAAWFHYWCEIGRRMGITDIPSSKAEYDRFIAAYEAREMVYSEESKQVADATIAIMEGWLPPILRRFVKPVAACLVRPQFARAAGFAPPARPVEAAVRGALKLRAAIKSVVSIERYAKPIAQVKRRTYPDSRYHIEELGPDAMRPRPQSPS
jgi:hypothetical protein